MTNVRVTCPSCGEVSLTPEDIGLVVCRNDPERSYYEFDCSTSATTFRKEATDYVISLLSTANVVAHIVIIPDECFEEHTGSRFGDDDILDMMLDLRDLTSDKVVTFLAPDINPID